jgi:hypothetical protein
LLSLEFGWVAKKGDRWLSRRMGGLQGNGLLRRWGVAKKGDGWLRKRMDGLEGDVRLRRGEGWLIRVLGG